MGLIYSHHLSTKLWGSRLQVFQLLKRQTGSQTDQTLVAGAAERSDLLSERTKPLLCCFWKHCMSVRGHNPLSSIFIFVTIKSAVQQMRQGDLLVCGYPQTSCDFLSPLLPEWRLSKCFSGWSWDDAFGSTFILAPKTHYSAQIYLCLLAQRGLCFAPRCGWKSTSALWSHMKMLLLQPRRMKQALCF